jgi:hypothetical protein
MLFGMEESVVSKIETEALPVTAVPRECKLKEWVIQSLEGKIDTSKLLRELREQKRYVDYDLLQELLKRTTKSIESDIIAYYGKYESLARELLGSEEYGEPAQRSKVLNTEIDALLLDAVLNRKSSEEEDEEFELGESQYYGNYYARQDVIAALLPCVDDFTAFSDSPLQIEAVMQNDFPLLQLIAGYMSSDDLIKMQDWQGTAIDHAASKFIVKKKIFDHQVAAPEDSDYTTEDIQKLYDGMVQYIAIYQWLKAHGAKLTAVEKIDALEKQISDIKAMNIDQILKDYSKRSGIVTVRSLADLQKFLKERMQP